MIQRIQTVYLLLVFCLMLLIPFLPVASSVPSTWNWGLSGISGLTAVLSLFTVFFYKNRKKQIKFCCLINFLILLFYLTLFLSNLSFSPNFSFIKDYGFSYTVAFPLIALLFNLLAIKGVKKDEKLVRSADRLR